MPNQFDHNTVQQYGGVAWAKEQANLLDPGAIDDQINGYASVKASLNQIVDTLHTANASIQSAWSGDAATSAAQTFTDTSNHAQNVVTTVDNTITQLQTAKTAASNAKAAMAAVPDEKPVPSGGLLNSFSNAMSDIFTGTDPTQQAVQHNTTARTQAADVLNKLSDSYDTAANNMTSIAGSNAEGSGFTASNPSTGNFNLGSASYSSGSGAARGYSSSTSSPRATTSSRPPSAGGVTNGVFEDSHTSLQSATTLPAPSNTSPIETGNLATSTATTTPGPIFGNLGGGLTEPPAETSKSGTASEEGLFGNSAEERNAGGKSKLGSSNVFEENGFGSESAGTSSRRGSSLGAGGAEGEGVGSGVGRGGAAGASEEQQRSGMQHGAGGGRGGGASDEEELGSSKYSRGRHFGGEEPGAGSDEWVQPSIGGDESLLVKGDGHGSGTGRVTSAYEGATDADGNPLRMMRGAGRPGSNGDEEDERGERPGYLKEDPEWWQSAQRVAPPVVE
jgi:uncharacterized protein YukE